MTSSARIIVALLLSARVSSAQLPSDPLPASTLPLRLVGVISDSGVPSRSAGLIQCGDPDERRGAWLFAVGDRACDVADIREIRSDTVIIWNVQTNQLERLSLPQSSVWWPVTEPTVAVADAGDGRAEVARPLVQATTPGVVVVELEGALLKRYLANLPDVLNAALAQPHYASATAGPAAIDGYEVSRIRSGGIVEQMGLQNGDVLLDFNGQTLDSLSAVMALLGRATALDGGKMTVLRGGTKVTFLYRVT